MPLTRGTRLGPYVIVELLGAGGMGEVYRAKDSRLGREVAIKILNDRMVSSPGYRERFAHEARAVSAVEDPHICALYDVGSDGGVDYLVMQYIDGDTLGQRIARGPIPVPEAIAIGRQVTAGLEAAHERGILHRDLKPSNIKLAPDGTAKILDFGLAKAVEVAAPAGGASAATTAVAPLTERGEIVGTIGYMSPEQALGRAVDRRADIWAFGCVLFEMLTGKRAFDGENASQVLARRRREVWAESVVGLMAAAFATALFFAAPVRAQEQPAAPPPRQLSLENKPWTGDFDAMLERRIIRVLVPYSRTLYFVDKGRERGLTADLARDFEQYLNTKYAKKLGKRPVTVLLIPTTRDKLLSGVVDGLGDVAAGNLTATDERKKIVDFVTPANHTPTREVLVTGPSSPQVATLADLSGKTVDVRAATSYYESVQALNQSLRASGKPPVNVVDLPAPLEDEDVLEMLNAGLVSLAVVDDWKADMWAQVLPKIKVRDDVALRTEAFPGWAVRKGSPQLVTVATAFYQHATKLHSREARLAQYYRRIKQINNNAQGPAWKRFEATIKLFEEYGEKYHFDPLMLAAQGYQESRLRQEARSHMGAIGVMQIMPATGQELAVGDITHLEPNIHAGAKYMNRLMTRYFSDANFDEANRTLFGFACYNAGPGNISRMRKIAIQRGLDGDLWFNNVEIVVAQKIGIETTTYVRNIYKYYVAYKLVEAAQEAASKAKADVGRSRP